MEWEPSATKELEKKGRNVVTIDDVKDAVERVGALMGKDEKTTKIAVVRCDIVSETCPGVACFKAFNKRKIHFGEYGPDAQIIGFFTCGGCPGRRVYRLVDSLIKHGVDVIHLSSCMLMESSYPKCPHLEGIKQMIHKKGIRVVEGTHH